MSEPLDILIVEDDTLNARLLNRFCRSLGHLPRVAVDGSAALASVAKRTPDLVLLDLMLPIVDGFGVLTELRSKPATKALPVIMVTAVQDAETHARLIDLGANDIVIKPYRFKLLKARMEAVLAAGDYLAGLND